MSGWTLVPIVVLVAAMAASSVRKARRSPSSLDLRNRLGVAPGLWSAIGALEACAALGLVAGTSRPAVGAAAACGVCLLMLGAVVVHVRAGLVGRPLVAPVVLLVAAVSAVVGFGAGL